MTYKHANYHRALKTLMALVKADLSQFMIFIIGVSRVGKSTLQRDLIHHLPKEWREKIIRFEAPPKMTSQFTFKPFLLRYLDQLGDPFCMLQLRSYKRMRNHELIDMIVKRIKQKGIRLVIIDEADLFVSVRGLAQAYENLQFLKSLVNITGIPHVFAGTPDLGEFLSMEGQVINRSHVVKLAPYSYENDTHVKIFLQALNVFEKKIQVPISKSLKKDPKLLFKVTNGCIGALKELLVRMEAMAIGHDQDEISPALIEMFGYYDPDDVREEEILDFYGKNTPSKSKKENFGRETLRRCRKSNWTKSGAKHRRKPGKRKHPIDEIGTDL